MKQLLGKRGFLGLLGAQFLAAFNDNAMRQSFLLLAVAAQKSSLQATATALFALPFLVFSILAGQIADKFSKRTVIIATKLFELLVVFMAGYALYHEDLTTLLISILMMATQSSFFSPAKYGILPELMDEEKRPFTGYDLRCYFAGDGRGGPFASIWRNSCAWRCNGRSWRGWMGYKPAC